jgi:hypothetical protein
MIKSQRLKSGPEAMFNVDANRNHTKHIPKNGYWGLIKFYN